MTDRQVEITYQLILELLALLRQYVAEFNAEGAAELGEVERQLRGVMGK